MHHQGDTALAALFAEMRLEGIKCRAYEDETGIELLWRPKPRELPFALREKIKGHAGALACLLVPTKQGGPVKMRPFWNNGPLSKCIGCGHHTLFIDPLGQPRHDWCGWLGKRLQHQTV